MKVKISGCLMCIFANNKKAIFQKNILSSRLHVSYFLQVRFKKSTWTRFRFSFLNTWFKTLYFIYFSYICGNTFPNFWTQVPYTLYPIATKQATNNVKRSIKYNFCFSFMLSVTPCAFLNKQTEGIILINHCPRQVASDKK